MQLPIPSHLALGHVYDPGFPGQIDKHQRIGDCGINGQTAQDVVIAIQESYLAVFGAQSHVVDVLPLRDGNQRNGPDTGLTRFSFKINIPMKTPLTISRCSITRNSTVNLTQENG